MHKSIFVHIASIILVTTMVAAADNLPNINVSTVHFVALSSDEQQGNNSVTDPRASKPVATLTPATTITPQATAISTPQPTPVEQEDIDRLSEETYKNYAYPLDTIPPIPAIRAQDWSNQHVQNAIPDGMDVNAGGTRLNSGFALTSTSWTSFGPQPEAEYPSSNLVSGRVTALAVSPVATSTVYAGMAGGGVWKSTNCCGPNTSFAPVTDDPLIASSVIGSISIAATSPYTIYAGTGEGNFCGNDCLGGRGVLRSTNGGTGWVSLTSDFINNTQGYPLHISSIAEDSHNPSIVAAGVFAGVGDAAGAVVGFCSTSVDEDGAEGWIQNIGVIEGHRRAGLGRALLLSGIAYLRPRTPLILLGAEDYNTKAVALYESVGFTVKDKGIALFKDLG